MSDGRMVYIPHENIMGEIVSEQMHGAMVKYFLGGFEVTEYLTADDYEILEYFDEGEE